MGLKDSHAPDLLSAIVAVNMDGAGTTASTAMLAAMLLSESVIVSAPPSNRRPLPLKDRLLRPWLPPHSPL